MQTNGEIRSNPNKTHDADKLAGQFTESQNCIQIRRRTIPRDG